MKVPLVFRILCLILAGISLFWFPWVITIFLMFLAGLVFPFAALALGVIADLIYYPGTGYPLGTLTGAIILIISSLVRHFVKTRIM